MKTIINPAIKERIISAANTLASEGIESPTNDQVRERMGGGSLSHISPVMREWRTSRKKEVNAALEMPGDLKKIIEGSLAQIWTTASKLASSATETVRQETGVAIANITLERDEALTEIQRLESHIETLEKNLMETNTALSELRENTESVLHENNQLKNENNAFKSRVENKDQQITILSAELKDARENNKSLQYELLDIAKKFLGEN